MKQTRAVLSLVNIKDTVSHIYQGLHCLLVLSGTLNILQNDCQYHLTVDDMTAINPAQLCVLSGDPSALVLSLQIPEEFLKENCRELYHTVVCCNSSDAEMRDNEYFYELKRCMVMMKVAESEKEYGYQLQMKILLLRLLQILYIHFGAEQVSSLAAEVKTKDRTLEEILSYLQTAYHQDFTVQEIAPRFYMSPNYFSKYFKRHVGMSFSVYMKKIRLEHAVKDLLLSDESVSGVAMKNGFPNFQSFNSAFKQMYGCTPASYRRKYGDSRNLTTANVEMGDTVDQVNTTEFLRHVRRYNVDSYLDDRKARLHEVDISKVAQTNVQFPQNLLNIDRFDYALRARFVESIQDVKQLGMQYVYFRFPLQEFNLEYNQNPLFSELAQAIESLERFGLIPFFKVLLPEDMVDGMGKTHRVLDCFSAMLQLLKNWFSPEYATQWKFELCPETEEPGRISKTYAVAAACIKNVFPGAWTGLACTEPVVEAFEDVLCACGSEAPDFITISVFPNAEKRNYLPDIMYYPFGNFHRDMAIRFGDICQRIMGRNVPIYMTDWNTLTGSNDAEVDVYFRPALIMQALWETRDLISGTAFWFDTPASYFATGEDQTISLALYLYGQTRRPVYYVLELFRRMGKDVLYEDSEDHIAVTRNGAGEWVVLAWNPSFLNPRYCLEDSHLKQEARNVRIRVCGLQKGKYRIKRVVLERDSSGLQAEYIRSGYPDTSDPDVHRYMQETLGKKLYFSEEWIGTGEYLISDEIGFNGIIMYVFRLLE